MAPRKTGIEVLDRRLDGGIPEGSVVALVAPPESNAELFLYQLTSSRPTLYLTSIRSAAAVRDALEATRAPKGEPKVHELGTAEPLDRANRAVGQLRGDATLIVDPVDPLESRETSRFVSFLNELQTHMQNTSNIAVLHCLADDDQPPNRRMTLHAADVVFNLDMEVRGSNLVNRLTVPKLRGGRAITEEIKLELTEEVAVDTSRDIA